MICITGGEPTLHPQILEIFSKTASFKNRFSPETIVRIYSNGYGPEVQEVLNKVPREIEIINAKKTSAHQEFQAFSIAPIDCVENRYVDYLNGCGALECGISLTPHGYYPCAIGGGIDRVFGSNIGRKRMPDKNDQMIK